MKTWLKFLLIFAIMGVILGAILGPIIIPLISKCPVGDVCMGDPIFYMQLGASIGLIVGILLGLISYVIYNSFKKR